ncbi:CPBP family intramembrane glutamic endopeptidase [Herbidospora mongoliensis]|uniref:CPBP family intramembrane glutamic endopeptidase n=1 Tax=Herbidospora mongoliensis TaxID=688067 RepID=UPI000B18B6E9|nr:CPBP family intramembrane glutamic endopeptidase [Herbidospora mongoliensis]
MNTTQRSRSPLIWLPAGLIGVGGVSALASGGAFLAVVAAAAALAVYWTVMRFVARRPMPELATRGAGREALSGGAIGLGFVLLSVLVITVFGGYSFTWSQGLSAVLPLAAVSIGAAVTEELLFRGLALQALEGLLGSRAALAITALLFGALHLANPGATLWSSLAIAVEAGVLLGAAFLWRRSIWFVIGLHFTWNVTVALLGIPVSGHPSEGVLTTHVSGPEWLTGGAFGLEASVVPVVVSVLIAAAMLVRARLVRR